MDTPTRSIPDHLIWAILATLFCCLPLGIVSLIHAARVDAFVRGGDLVAAQAASDAARRWAIGSAVIGPVLMGLALVAAVSMGLLAQL